MSRFEALAAGLLGATLLATPAAAGGVTVGKCDWLGQMLNIPEPWEDSTRTFYQGQVRAVMIDSVEPACCWAHLALLVPDPTDELGLRQCVVINQGDNIGFGGIEFEALRASYDPAIGLTLTFPYSLYDPETGGTLPPQIATVLINLATGQITAR